MNTIPSVAKRKELLKKLLKVIQNREKEIEGALFKDFSKPPFETFITEFNYVISDLKHTIKQLNTWSKPKKVTPSLFNFPSSEFIYNEPYGKVLIISPWNYPFQLAICPLVAAIAAGNTVVLKPSEISYHTSELLSQIISEVFDVKEAIVILGGVELTQKELQKKWDYIFFTGSTRVGKIIALEAAKNLTPCTLELGGKSPCIVDETANIDIAAKRIVWGKFLNAGQTCVAPDYILVHATQKFDLVQKLKNEILQFYGENPQESPDFARIINKDHWNRLLDLIDKKKIIEGGIHDDWTRYIAPSLIDEPEMNDPIMQEEIFGPILPIISYSTFEDIEKVISQNEKPLALYVFSENKEFSETIIRKFNFGGGCVNDCIMHLVNHRLPFGGIGNSGMGAYHGKHGFETFSHKKAIVKRGTSLDIPLRYAPYNKRMKWKKFLQWFS
ncbi:MAG: aldehyde dehydrogenase [Flavobacterium sp.]